ncbi:uncharacterized protein LOC106161446 [Lingula anatina]|uniref:Uncharacterized protein LOC106161446 n=1 Tax=Lingula anatina TaxID=7574 RepID=A0A2R2MMS2_LINAN|nr:uncharacterized protein LOC106161446 [Lingula anatina]|eukprot:XP_023931533.1 uncharacterized protein LOC106161446 [Lingula anatina]
MHQIDITWKFSLVPYCDHEMILKVLKNFVPDEQDSNDNNVYKLVTAYYMVDCNPNITFVETVRDLIQNQGKNLSPFQLLSIAHNLICHHGYREFFSEILDCVFESDLMKEEFLSELSPGRIKMILELCGRLEIEQIDRYVKKIPPSLYKVCGVQVCAEKLKTNCQLSSVKAVLAAVQMNLGGSHMSRIMPVLPIYLPIVECCLNEVNEPVDMELVPRVFDESGFLKVENLSALPEGWRRIAVLVLPSQYKHLFINKPAYTGDFKAKLRFLGRAGYQKVVLVTKVPMEEKLHKCIRDILKEIPDIRLPDN